MAQPGPGAAAAPWQGRGARAAPGLERKPQLLRLCLSALAVLLSAGVAIRYQGAAQAPPQATQSTFAPSTESLSSSERTGTASSSSELSVSDPARCLLAIGDIHGDLLQAQRALQLVGATDESGEWVAGACTLVQTGDLVDRGDDSLAVLRLFEELKAKAAAGGGRVVTLLGNHELESVQVRARTRAHVILLLSSGHCLRGASSAMGGVER
jgi:Calcineurin-like phosphoesterase